MAPEKPRGPKKSLTLGAAHSQLLGLPLGQPAREVDGLGSLPAAPQEAELWPRRVPTAEPAEPVGMLLCDGTIAESRTTENKTVEQSGEEKTHSNILES